MEVKDKNKLVFLHVNIWRCVYFIHTKCT